MESLRASIDKAFEWLGENARSFSFMLPDTLELALYVALAMYFTMQVVVQQPQI